MELIVIFIVALLVIGPEKLPEVAHKFGAAMREFRKASQDATEELRESVIDPLEEAQRPLREAMEPLDELNRSVKADIASVEKEHKTTANTTPKQAEQAAPVTAPAEEAATAEKGGDAI